jgi:hypothetical protein
MANYKVKLGLSEKDVPTKVEFGNTVHTAMTRNPLFTTPNPTLMALQTMTTALDSAFQASKHGVLSTTLLHKAENNFDILMTALGNYVDSIAQGSKSTIESAAMEASAASHVPVVMTQVVNVEGSSGKMTGDIIRKWKPVQGVHLYLGYLKAEDMANSDYKLVVFSTKTKVIVSGLVMGAKYSLMVQAVGASGMGPLSDPASAHAAF